MTLTTEREFNIKYELDQAASAIEAARKLLLMPDPPPAKPLFLRIGEPKAVLDLFPDCPLYHVFNVPPTESGGFDWVELRKRIGQAPPECNHFVIDREGPLREAIEFWDPDIAIPELKVRESIVQEIKDYRPGALVSDYGVVAHRKSKTEWEYPSDTLIEYLSTLDFLSPSFYPNRPINYYRSLADIAERVASDVLEVTVSGFLTHRSLPSFAVLDPPTQLQWVQMLSQYVDGGCSWEADKYYWKHREAKDGESAVKAAARKIKREWFRQHGWNAEDVASFHVEQRILTIETMLDGLNG